MADCEEKKSLFSRFAAAQKHTQAGQGKDKVDVGEEDILSWEISKSEETLRELIYGKIDIFYPITYIEYRSDDVTNTFFFAFRRFEYHILVEHDKKPPQSKFGANRFMGARDAA